MINIKQPVRYMKMSILRLKGLSIVAASLVVMLSACGDVVDEYSSQRCYFVFDNSVHKDITLASAMDMYSAGVFCKISQSMGTGGIHINFENNRGLSSYKIANATDIRRPIQIGQNNSLIVGYSNLDSPAKFYAFDGECPNCFSEDAIPVRSYPLEIRENGTAVCKVCLREYGMNNGGARLKGEKGRGMVKYRCSTTGAWGTLSVN